MAVYKAVYDCGSCGTREVLSTFVPDCCSFCGSKLNLIAGDAPDLARLEELHFEAMETAYAREGMAAGEMRRAAVANCLFVAIAALILLGTYAASGRTMAACEQVHSFETCFFTLNR